ncbi:MAG: RecX family transcriptional regulator [Bernardetiaceae bacterium]|jgi:regulatory protein|nr:RecX family transcriptional regulator [Bernardetiaceae bacterium]
MDFTAAYAKAAAYCAYQDRCLAEVRAKLTAWEVPPSIAAQVLAQLQAEKFLDEARFARSFASGKFRYHQWGRLKIKQALRLKGVAAAHIAEALAQLDEADYLATLQKLASAKKATTLAARAAAYRSLVAKGYEPELVAKLIKP